MLTALFIAMADHSRKLVCLWAALRQKDIWHHVDFRQVSQRSIKSISGLFAWLKAMSLLLVFPAILGLQVQQRDATMA